MDRRAFFGTLSLGLVAGLTATAVTSTEAEAATRRARQTAADCPRSAPCTSSRGTRFWISDDGRRHTLRRRRRTTTTPA